jgi:septum formation protein
MAPSSGSDAKIILASASPRRKELLEQAGVPFEIIPAEVDESVRAAEAPLAYALRVAEEKARTVARSHPGRWVLGADTIVVIPDDGGGGEILGKPLSKDDALGMLRRLSGRDHEVVTAGVFVREGSGAASEIEIFAAASRVVFRELSDEEIWDYIASGEPMDKAGAYAIQGGAARFVVRYDGSWSNIVGLPLEEVLERWNRLTSVYAAKG